MHLLAKNSEYQVGTLLSNFLDFSRYTVDSSKINTENNLIRLLFFLVLHSTLNLVYMLWLNFIFGLNFAFLCIKLIIIHCHTPKQRK